MIIEDRKQFWIKNFPSFGMFHASYSSVSENIQEEDSIQLTRKISYKIIAPIIISLGLLGNILTVIILKSKRFHGVTYDYFFALAISDLVSLLFSISATVHLLHPVTKSFLKAYWYSHFETLLVNAAMGTSVLIVVCITVDRYFSVCRPHSFKIIHTKRKCIVGICMSIVLSVIVWMPTSFLMLPETLEDCNSYHSVTQDSNETYWVSCQVVDRQDDIWYNTYAWGREILIAFIPIVLVITLNALLLHRYRKIRKVHSNPIYTFSKSASKRVAHDADAKILISLLQAIMISVLLTLLPAGVFNAAYLYNDSVGLNYEIFQAVSNNLQLLNHASNFYLYILLSKPVRDVIPHYAKKVCKMLDEKWLSWKLNKIGCLEEPAAHCEVSKREVERISFAERRKQESDSQDTIASDFSDRNSNNVANGHIEIISVN